MFYVRTEILFDELYHPVHGQATEQHGLMAANGCLSCDYLETHRICSLMLVECVIRKIQLHTSLFRTVSKGRLGRIHNARKNWACWFIGERRQYQTELEQLV